jgi:hypothetical protein
LALVEQVLHFILHPQRVLIPVLVLSLQLAVVMVGLLMQQTITAVLEVLVVEAQEMVEVLLVAQVFLDKGLMVVTGVVVHRIPEVVVAALLR